MPIVNGLEEARAALRAGAVDLASPPYAACHAGVNYYQALLARLRAEFSQPFSFTLCCGDDPAIAHDALRLGFTKLYCACREGVLAELQAVAAPLGAVVKRPEA